MGFTIVFLIAAIGIPASMLFMGYAMAKGARQGQALADAIKDSPEAKAVVMKYERYAVGFVWLLIGGMIVVLCGTILEMASNKFPPVCLLGFVPVIIGQIGMHWANSVKIREVERLAEIHRFGTEVDRSI